jgi:phenylalanyl-tRNA synthetase alpha subunit
MNMDLPTLHPAVAPGTDILAEMGFQVYRLAQVETDEMNFQLLNSPSPPCAHMQDSLYVGTAKRSEPGEEIEYLVLMRTHTSRGRCVTWSSPRVILKTLRHPHRCPGNVLPQ